MVEEVNATTQEPETMDATGGIDISSSSIHSNGSIPTALTTHTVGFASNNNNNSNEDHSHRASSLADHLVSSTDGVSNASESGVGIVLAGTNSTNRSNSNIGTCGQQRQIDDWGTNNNTACGPTMMIHPSGYSTSSFFPTTSSTGGGPPHNLDYLLEVIDMALAITDSQWGEYNAEHGLDGRFSRNQMNRTGWSQ
jgi:hypothetical protein